MAKKIAVSVDMLGNGVHGLATPVAASDAVNKGYVDELAASLSVRMDKAEEADDELSKRVAALSAYVSNVDLKVSNVTDIAVDAMDAVTWKAIKRS